MKLISWNVNGIRACIKKGFIDFLERENPDIIWLQEIKWRLEQVEKSDIEKMEKLWYKLHFNPAVRPGYSGVAVLSKIEPISVYNGINTTWLELDKIETDEVIEENHEGRVITAEFADFYFVTVYIPNSKRELERLDYRQIWDHVFLKYIKHLEKTKKVFVCWDLNVAHKEIDLTHPKANVRNAWFTIEERNGMDNYVNEWLVDTFRYFYPDKIWAYSRWSNFWNARAKNVGWRIDYFLWSQWLKDKLENAFILPEVLGSDHCPVWITLK
jgi:exodeoxyribonuclease-3